MVFSSLSIYKKKKNKLGFLGASSFMKMILGISIVTAAHEVFHERESSCLELSASERSSII
jgi:galactitol-specific phosphotransferase system IIC component